MLQEIFLMLQTALDLRHNTVAKQTVNNQSPIRGTQKLVHL